MPTNGTLEMTSKMKNPFTTLTMKQTSKMKNPFTSPTKKKNQTFPLS